MTLFFLPHLPCQRDAFFEEFAEDAIITTELGQRLTDLKKFEDAIKKYEGVQTSAKKLVRYWMILTFQYGGYCTARIERNPKS